ncbi:hypothetical protein E1263_26780 [Kribbella antibiotica]|uniref:DUF2975 domain-containing protein n=1 Tax=Kribbella antibiotica TaxID=190195 RepID=A0A4R4Z8N2_9ACTN|nr:hypothetical protein [Kribbella antibiotica]TDD54661.1 hypothetical protein E1263_26780 [Kribbella antibiotica]
MTNQGVQHRPNVLFNLAGLVLIVAGLALLLYGVVRSFAAVAAVGPNSSIDDLVPIVGNLLIGMWGGLIFTFGRYLWRGARKRGFRDRFGRLLIILGYGLIGIALTVGLVSAMDGWSAGFDGDALQEIGIRSVLIIAVIGFPGAALCGIGFRLAREQALAQAEAKGEF